MRDYYRQKGGYRDAGSALQPLSYRQRVAAMVKACFSDWPTFIGTFVQGINIVVLVRKLAGQPVAEALPFLYGQYFDFLRNKIFVVFDWIGFAVPDQYIMPLAIWITFGVIYARAWIKLNDEKSKQFARLLADDVWMGEYRKLNGKAKADEYARFLEDGQKELTLSLPHKILVHIVSIAFFPMFAPMVTRPDLIIDDRFWDPAAYFNARIYIAVETLMVAGWASAMALLQ